MSPTSYDSDMASMVASDFKEALSGLQENNLYSIRSLTTIARDQLEYAAAIAQTLIKHVQESPPYRKLIGLYVLDSIVKNVGSPYQLYFASNLFKTFMDAYALVDNQTRKQMENMLKTWKYPMQGSLDQMPVFPPSTTQPIENALQKARNAFLQHQSSNPLMHRQAHALPPRPVNTPYSSWNGSNGPAPGMANVPSPSMPHPNYSGHPPNGYPYHQPQSPFYPQPHQPNGSTPPHPPPTQYQWVPPPEEFNKLRTDLENLIARTKTQFATNIGNTELQSTLKSLLDLQTYINTQRASYEDWHRVKAAINRISASGIQTSPNPASAPHPYPSNHASNPAKFAPQNQAHGTPHPNSTPAPPPIKPEALAELLSSTTQSQRPTPSTPTTSAQALPGVGAKGGADTNNLIASLLANGLLPAATPHSRPSSTAGGQSAYQPPQTSTHHVTQYDVQLTTASIRISRPHSLRSLYSSRPSQCSSCGRRFPITQAGKKRKARHLDYHFRINQKFAETSNRAVHRSWYIDEMEWIRFREVDDADAEGDGANGKNTGVEGHRDSMTANGDTQDGNFDNVKKARYIKAPTDVSEVNDTCPICQDKFETTWHDEAQEFVWMDAVTVGSRIYHGTCYDEISPPEDRSTPMPSASQNHSASTVLGKRKSDSSDGESKKIKLESHD